MHDLVIGRYLQEKARAPIVGPSGAGKSHMTQALGHCAMLSGTSYFWDVF